MIHKTAEVQTEHVGKNTQIWQYTVVLKGAKIGSNCNINCHCFIENDVVIGDNVTVKSGVYLWDGIEIDDDVFIGPGASFVNDLHVRSKQYPKQHLGPKLGRGASIGANATIIGDIKIGKYALVGAGAVVTKDVKPYATIVGNPGKHIGYVTRDGISLTLDFKEKNGPRSFFFNELDELIERLF